MRNVPDTYPADRVPLLPAMIAAGSAACIVIAVLATLVL